MFTCFAPAISKLINKNILLQTEHPGCTDPSREKELSAGGDFYKSMVRCIFHLEVLGIKKLKPNIYITTLTDVYTILIVATFGGEPVVL